MSRLALLLATSVVCTAASAARPGLVLNVSPGGTFTNLADARDAIRALKADSGLPAGGVLVEVAAGTYEMPEPLALEAQDSGTSRSPIVYRAQGEVRLSGGRNLTGWRPVTDKAVLARLAPEARSKVRVTDLRAQGVTDFGEMKSADNWAQSDPGLELFFGDKPMTLARWPNEGYTKIADIVVDDGHQIFGMPGSMACRFHFEGDRPARWVDEPAPMVHGYWFFDWADQRYRVGQIDPATKEMVLTGNPHGFGFRKGQWYYAYNLLCELDQPGEWYLDREGGLLYFWPPSPMGKAQAAVSITRGLLNCKDVSNVTFQGFTLECARGTGVTIQGGQEVRIGGCVLRNLGGQGVEVTGGRGHSVKGCDIYQLGDGGITLTGGDRMTLTPAKHVADNNHIHHCSRWNPLYHPGIQLNDCGNEATHNLVDNLPHIAINFTGNDQVIEYNEIHSVCQQANDNGAVYTSPPTEDWSMRGHRVRFNYLHDLYGFEGRGCSGVYLDDLFSSADISHNLFVRVSNGILIGGGRDNLMDNNVFVQCPRAFSIDARGLGWCADAKTWMPPLLEQWPYRGPIWSARYPELVNVLEDEPTSPKGNKLRRNVCWEGPWGWIEGPAVKLVEQADNLIGEDPRFVDAAAGDYRLREDSPALKAGFEPLPLDQIGPYRSRWRASWPVTSQVAPAPEPPAAGPTLVRTRHTRPPLQVPTAAPAPQVDGVLAAGEWPEAKVLLAETPERNPITSAPVTCRVCVSGQTLYVGMSVPVADVSKLNRDDAWGRSDGAEVAFRDASGKKPGTTYGVRGFATGKWESYTDAGATPEQAEALARVAKFAAQIGDTGWSCEWALPLDAASIRVRRGLKLGLNMGVLRSEETLWLLWCGPNGPCWDLDYAGRAVVK